MSASVIKLSLESAQSYGSGIKPGDIKFVFNYAVTLSARDELGAYIAKTASYGAISIPQDGTYLTSPAYLIVERVESTLRGSSGLNWTVKVTAGQNPLITLHPEPWLRKPLIDISQKIYPWVMEEDYNSDPAVNDGDPQACVNSARDPFDPPLMTERINTLLMVKWAQKVSDLDMDAVGAIVGTINTSAVSIRGTSYDVKTALLRAATGRETTWLDGTIYWDLVYTIEVTRMVDVAKLKVLDRGYHYWYPPLSSGNGQKYLIAVPGPNAGPPLAAGQEYTASPQLLDGEGNVLDTSGTFTPIYKTFVPHDDADWAPLNLT